MKGLERIIWVTLAAILTIGAAVLWAAWQSSEEVWGNEQYLNYMHMLRLQQNLKSNNIDAAVTSNRDWLSMYWRIFMAQEQTNSLLISEKNFNKLKDEVEGSQLGITLPEKK